MSFIGIFMIGLGLSMDAFAVSVCKGLGVKQYKVRYALITGLYFGIFQALMPLIGFVLGYQFKVYIEAIDHWIAFFLLLAIGGNMIREAIKDDEACPVYPENDKAFSFKAMIPLAIATSIDALAVGITFAFLHVPIIQAVCIIGITTFVISFAGVKIGNVFGSKFKKRAEIAGGIILILIGAKILLEHLGIIG
ncbi:MAG: manganese efflux pump MntP family protein [Suipraeoptans sp.]